MGYIGATPSNAFINNDVQRVTNSTNNYVDLDHNISSLDSVIVFVNNVRQESTNLTFTSASRIGLGDTLQNSDVVEIVFIGKAVSTQSPATGSVTSDMLSGSIANSKLANSSITLNGSAVSLGGSATIGGDNAPYFYAFRSGNQTGVSSSTWTTVIHNSEVVDSENSYNSSTGQWTPSVAGYYQINAMLTTIPDANVDQMMVAIKSSSHSDPRYANFIKLGSTNLNRFSGAVSGIVYSNGSQTIESRVYIVGQGGSVFGEVQYTSFSGYRIIT